MEIALERLRTTSSSTFPAETSPIEKSDIQWFNSSLEAPAPDKAPLGESLVSTRSSTLNKLSEQSAKLLQRTSRSTTPTDILETSRAMSKTHLETVVTAKAINKCVQSIEKLTNLA